MIKVNSVLIIPTIFPDNTSQVWKLPNALLEADEFFIEWYFEQERELFDLFSLRQLFLTKPFNLYIPYLPYARQDKEPGNDTTFNLTTFAKLLNMLNCASVTSVDVHSPVAASLINNFHNKDITPIIKGLVYNLKIDYIVYPDKGAWKRYNFHFPNTIIFDKIRDQLTGEIKGHEIIIEEGLDLGGRNNMLIVDDLCDGGATFLGMVDKLKEEYSNVNAHLYVTHGLFSKGKKILEDTGLTLHTTNSLLKNKDGIPL